MSMVLTEKQLYILEKISDKINFSDSFDDYESAAESWYEAQIFVSDLLSDLNLELLSEKQRYIIEKINHYIFIGHDADVNEEVNIWYEGLEFVKDLLIDFRKLHVNASNNNF